jgi:hypothetical protein
VTTGQGPAVGIVMGSDSDFPMMSEAVKTLEKFGIAYEMEVLSAHRTPARAHEYATTAVSRGLKVIIAAAGAAAHLAGVMAANTTLRFLRRRYWAFRTWGLRRNWWSIRKRWREGSRRRTLACRSRLSRKSKY